MSFVTDLIGELTGANAAADAAQQAAGTQAAFSQKGIDEQRRQFDKVVELLNPYVQAGAPALGAQQDLLGLNGASAQSGAIAGIEASPQFGALVKQGENALLQNASATGGLRGGNLQAALAKFRPSALSQLIEQQFSRLGGITSIGQNAAAFQGNAGMNSANQISNLFGQQGAYVSGGQIAQGRAGQQAFNDALGIAGAVSGFMRPTPGVAPQAPPSPRMF